MKFERLEEKITQIRGISYKLNEISAIPMPDYLPILKANNIQEEGIDTSDLIYIHKSKIKPEQFIKKGDLLLAASSGSKEIVGKNIYFESDFDGSFGAFCKLVRPKTNLNPRYLATFFKSVPYKRHIKKLLSGALINNLKNEYINSLLIPELSDSDQLHIANILSKAENLIAQRKESIRLLDEFLKSTFLEMFGDISGEKVSLTSACIFNPKKSEISSLDNGTEVSFTPMASVSETGEVDLSQTRKLNRVWNGFTYFREGDVVFAKITPCMENGKGAIMKNLKNGIGFGTTEFHVLRPIDGISTSAWIYHLTMQDAFRKKAEQNMTGSAGQKRVRLISLNVTKSYPPQSNSKPNLPKS